MRNTNQPAFSPGGNTVSLAVTNSSGNVQVQTSNYMRHVRFYNTGSVIVFVNFGAANTVTASTTTSVPIGPGVVEIFSCSHAYVAAITSTGTATLYMTPGEGV